MRAVYNRKECSRAPGAPRQQVGAPQLYLHFLLSTGEPMRLEIILVGGLLLVHVPSRRPQRGTSCTQNLPVNSRCQTFDAAQPPDRSPYADAAARGCIDGLTLDMSTDSLSEVYLATVQVGSVFFSWVGLALHTSLDLPALALHTCLVGWGWLFTPV